MSNFTNNNLIAVTPADVPVGSLSAKIGGLYFVAANAVAQGANFYRCASVNTADNTWTGYKAVLSGGVYTFEATATTGLTFGGGYTPVPGNIYDSTASVQVARLWNGVVIPVPAYSIPLTEAAGTAASGQTITTTGTPVFSTVGGRSCAYLDGSTYFELPDTDIDFTGSITCSAMVRFDQTMGNEGSIISIGTPLLEDILLEYLPGLNAIRTGNSTGNDGGVFIDANLNASADTWYRMTIVRDISTSTLKVYVGGDLIQSGNFNRSLTRQRGLFIVGAWWYNDSVSGNFVGYLADVKIWNTALTAEQIANL